MIAQTPNRKLPSGHRFKPYETPSRNANGKNFSPAKEITFRFLEEGHGSPLYTSSKIGSSTSAMEEGIEVDSGVKGSIREDSYEIATQEELKIVINELQAAWETLRKAQLQKKASKRRLMEALAEVQRAQADFDASCTSTSLAEREVSEWRIILNENGYSPEDPTVTPVKLMGETFRLDSSDDDSCSNCSSKIAVTDDLADDEDDAKIAVIVNSRGEERCV